MTDLKSWDELTEQEQADFAGKVASAGIQGWTALKRLALTSGIEPDEDALPSIYELEHWTTPEVRRCCRTCAHCVITTKECYEGGTTDIGDLDRELTEEDCSAWTPREGSASPGADQLFSFPLDKVARLIGELESVDRRLNNLIPELQQIELESIALQKTMPKGDSDARG